MLLPTCCHLLPDGATSDAAAYTMLLLSSSWPKMMPVCLPISCLPWVLPRIQQHQVCLVCFSDLLPDLVYLSCRPSSPCSLMRTRVLWLGHGRPLTRWPVGACELQCVQKSSHRSHIEGCLYVGVGIVKPYHISSLWLQYVWTCKFLHPGYP